ncbi:MAG: selenium metabolism-associated LysR family transcriptional regulator [Carboxydocellales bacterium]
MNFNHLKVFWAVAKNLSYSRAAEELYLSQPTVSIQLKKLEEALGLDLLEQLGKKIYLTQAGELLYPYVNRIFSLATEAESAIQELKGLRAGRIIIGASTTPGIYLLPAIISSFQQNYPRLEISLEISNTHQVQEHLLLNQLDLGVVGEELTIDPQLIIQPLLADKLLIIAAKEHPLALRKSVSFAEFLTQRLILRERGSSTREILEQSVHSRGLQLKVAMQLNSIEAIKQAVIANLGVSVISKLTVGMEVKAGLLRAIPFSDLSLSRHINLAYHKEKKLSPVMQAFVQDIKKQLLGK